MKHRNRLLSTSTLCFSTMVLAASLMAMPVLAFDPDEGADATATSTATPLPSTDALTQRPRAPGATFPKIIQPSMPPIKFAPLKPKAMTAESAAAPVVTTATPAIAVPAKSVVVAAPVVATAPVVVQPVVTPALTPVESTPTPSTVKKIEFPPVDPAVLAKAQQLSATPKPVVVATPVVVAKPVEVTPAPSTITETPSVKPAPASDAGFIAPLPLMAPVAAAPVMPQAVTPVTVTPAPAVVAAPAVVVPGTVRAPVIAAPVPVVTATPVAPVVVAPAPAATAPAVIAAPVAAAPVIPEPTQPLSRASKSVLSRIPSHMDAPIQPKAAKLSLERTSPKVAPLEVKGGKVDAYESAGIKISVRRPGLDTNYELNRAFNSLSGGDTATAMEIYKSILSTEPENQDALFGLAAIYHRQGQIDKARPLYSKLLQVNPNHREGINNFLVLVSDESPQESLAELERLEQRNPDFSPIPAQEAIVLTKLGYGPQARDKMLRAIELAPDNLTYKYNLAIMLDKQGNYEQAVPLYRLLVDAANKGASIPASTESLQKRLNYISTVATAARTGVN